MSVKYTIVKQHNINQPDTPRYIAQYKSRGERDIHAIADDISNATSLNAADVAAMTEALLQILSRDLAAGYIVKLGDFGSFSLALSVAPQPDPKSVNPDSIKACKIKFRPGKRLIKQLASIRYAKK
ncbi:HU family DNA-binding protein [Parapedobacter sp. DT-150]|uniref:HU family DNA-binding protein n=1 Tax=Parapedobacter sp. DT-150 TaxID=3396162 RepID=UPI003F195CD1